MQRKVGNFSFGVSAAMLGPLIIKRMLFGVDDDEEEETVFVIMVETFFTPMSLVFLMIGILALDSSLL